MTTSTRKPAFTAYAVSGEGKQAFWTRIGSLWQHNHGDGFNIDPLFPLGQIVATCGAPDGDAAHAHPRGAGPSRARRLGCIDRV